MCEDICIQILLLQKVIQTHPDSAQLMQFAKHKSKVFQGPCRQLEIAPHFHFG